MNYFKRNWFPLSDSHDISQTSLATYDKAQNSNLTFVHFHSAKPWKPAQGKGAYLGTSPGHELWFDSMTRNQMSELMSIWRKSFVIREQLRILQGTKENMRLGALVYRLLRMLSQNRWL